MERAVRHDGRDVPINVAIRLGAAISDAETRRVNGS
jgi:hypothetical protein